MGTTVALIAAATAATSSTATTTTSTTTSNERPGLWHDRAGEISGALPRDADYEREKAKAPCAGYSFFLAIDIKTLFCFLSAAAAASLRISLHYSPRFA